MALGSILRYFQTINTPAPGVTDGALVAAYCAQRDEAAFGELVRRHARLVYAVCRRVLAQEADAEDAFQATFTLLARRASSVDCNRPLAGWLHAVAYQTALKARARRERRRQVEARENPRVTVAEPPPVEWQEVRSVLDQEMEALPTRERELILLCDVEGKGHRSVAEELRIPAGSVSRRLAAARDRLRERLSRRGVSLAAGAFAAILANEARAGIPARVVIAAIQVAVADAAGTVPAESIAALVVAVQRDLALTRFKTVAIATITLLAALAAASIGGYLALASSTHAPSQAVPDAKPEPATPGLRLVLEADRTETTLVRGQAAPVTLRLHFRNDTAQPIKVKVDHLQATWEKRFVITAIGPDEQSVHVEEKGAVRDDGAMGFFAVVGPDKSRFAADCTFPGTFSGLDNKVRAYSLTRPGRYRVRVRYANYDRDASPAAAGAWTGTVDSDELILTVRQEAPK